MIKRKIKLLSSFTSSVLFFFLAFILAVIIGNEIFINNSLKQFSKYDSLIVNDLGKIRGGIQRYVKFYIADKNEEKIKDLIDKEFQNITFYTTNSNSIIPDKYIIKFFDLYNTTDSLWTRIKNSNNKKEIFDLSEKVWKSANALTNLMAEISKYRFERLKKVVLFFTIASTFIILILSFLVLFFVKSGLEKATITDPLTKLYNRLYFDMQYKYLINKFKRHKTPFSAFLFDIDNFKKINDTYGHQTGDEILEKISKIIKRIIRSTDFAFRYGGEEFIILFPETKLKEAVLIADRIKRVISNNIKLNGKPITISGGVGEYNENFSEFFFLNEIDNALYKAKKSGKNRIVSLN